MGRHIFIKDSESLDSAVERAKAIKAEKDKGVGLKVCETEKEGNAFKKALVEAKATQPKDKAWRVDTDSHEGKDYIGCITHVTKGGSTIAIKNGDIISVCKNMNDKVKGSELLKEAVELGGTKLDSFSGNFAFYMKCGFEPVSWTRFDKKYKPTGWDGRRDREEPVVFFKYTGKKYKKHSATFWELKESQFYKKVKESKDYDTAMAVRDKEIK